MENKKIDERLEKTIKEYFAWELGIPPERYKKNISPEEDIRVYFGADDEDEFMLRYFIEKEFEIVINDDDPKLAEMHTIEGIREYLKDNYQL